MSTNKTKPILGIVMICHNDAGHLKRSIESSLTQMTEEVSFTFVDDSSSDGSGDLAKALLGDRGTVVRTPHNMNIGGARNHGVKCLNELPEDARPQYIWFHDSDDYICPGAIEKILKVIKENNSPDCVSVPVSTLRPQIDRSKDPTMTPAKVTANNIQEAAFGPVGEWAQVFKRELYVQNPPYQACEDAAWHYLQFDKFETWAKVEGEEPCYIWDRTNTMAVSETVDFCANNSNTIEGLAFSNLLVQRGLHDRWVSDNLRNVANMYDARHFIKKPWVKQAWAVRFRTECANLMSGHHTH